MTAGYEHPHWCNLAACDPHTDNGGAVHTSVGTMWPVQTDEVELTVQLVRSDDYEPSNRAARNLAPVRLLLTMLDGAFEAPDGSSPMLAAHVDPPDARMVAAMLNRYADMADREMRNGGPITVAASDLLHGADLKPIAEQ